MVALIGRSLRALPRAASDFEFLYFEIFSKKVGHHQIPQKLYQSIRLVELSKNMYILWGFEMVEKKVKKFLSIKREKLKVSCRQGKGPLKTTYKVDHHQMP